MSRRIILFFDLVITGLVAGTIFGIFIGYNPHHLSSLAYVEQQQGVINALNVLMPILGFVAILLTITSAFLFRKNNGFFSALFIASLLLIISGLVTRFGNQPINSIVIQWNLTEIPDNWMELRDKWWTFHTIRTVASLIGFILIAWTATIQKQQ